MGAGPRSTRGSGMIARGEGRVKDDLMGGSSATVGVMRRHTVALTKERSSMAAPL